MVAFTSTRFAKPSISPLRNVSSSAAGDWPRTGVQSLASSPPVDQDTAESLPGRTWDLLTSSPGSSALFLAGNPHCCLHIIEATIGTDLFHTSNTRQRFFHLGQRTLKALRIQQVTQRIVCLGSASRSQGNLALDRERYLYLIKTRGGENGGNRALAARTDFVSHLIIVQDNQELLILG